MLITLLIIVCLGLSLILWWTIQELKESRDIIKFYMKNYGKPTLKN